MTTLTDNPHSDFRRLSDWYAFTDLRARLPLLETRFQEMKVARMKVKAQVQRYEDTKERIPQHLEDAYKDAAWAWQRAYAAYTLARRVYAELLSQYPEWREDHAVSP